MQLFKHLGKKKNKKTKTDISKSFLEAIVSRFLATFQIIVFLFLILDIYFLASVFTFWTGKWGKTVGNAILDSAGGASLLLLLFFGYLCIAFLLRKKIIRPFSQIVATFLLFICCSILLGLFNVSNFDLHYQILKPGFAGRTLADFLVTNTGPLGAILVNFVFAVLAASLYGFIKIGFIRDKFDNIKEKILSLLTGPKKILALKKVYSDKLSKFKKIRTEKKRAKAPSHSVEPSEAGKPIDTHKSFQETDTPEESDEYDINGEGQFPEPYSAGDQGSIFPEIEPGQFPPPLDLFGHENYSSSDFDKKLIAEQGEQIITTLAQFGIDAELAETVIGPTVIQFQLQLAPGIKVSRVAGLSNDLAVALAVPSLRVEAPIPFKPYVGIEIPNPQRTAVPIRTIMENENFTDTDYVLPLISGLRVNSNPLIINLEELPHLLVAGTTGSGKSVFITSCITGLCSTRKPDEMRLLLIDPKRVELSIYEKLPHVLSKPVVDPRKAIHALGWAVREMEHRYEIFARTRVKNITSYNEKVLPKDRLNRIVIIIDELADLMFTAQKEVEDFICRIAQMARATGIHLIIATQRPSVNVITGLIKANIPARVAFTLPSQADSRTIIDLAGAEKLLGKGDMLFVSSKYPRPLRVQAPYIDESKSLNFVNYMKDLFGEPEYVDLEDQGDKESNGQVANLDDPLLEEAVNIVLNTGIASASRLQRQLRIGFTRAARLIDTLEHMGIVGPPEGSKPREILVDEETANTIFAENLK